MNIIKTPETSPYSFSRIGRRIDAQRISSHSFTPVKKPPQISPIKKAPRPKVDWMFKRVDRNTPVRHRAGDAPLQLNQSVYNPHYQILEKHVPNVVFKSERQRSASVSQRTTEFDTQRKFHIQLPTPFHLQLGRKDPKSNLVDTFYVQREQSRNNAHSFSSYSSRRPIQSDKQTMPDYDIVKSWETTQAKTVRVVNFSKLSQRSQNMPLTSHLDYDVKLTKHIQNIQFEKQVPRDKMNKMDLFKKIFQRVEQQVG